MAEANVLPIAAVAPVKPQQSGASNAQPTAEAPDQPSFAQVLKSRSNSAQNQAPQPAKPGGEKAEKAEHGKEISEDAIAVQPDQMLLAQTQSGILELLADAMNICLRGKQPLANNKDPKSTVAAPNNISELPTLNKDIDPATDPATDPAIDPAALAATAANIAATEDLSTEVRTAGGENEDVLSRGKNSKQPSLSDGSKPELPGTQDRQARLTEMRQPQTSTDIQIQQDDSAAQKGAAHKTSSFSNELALAQNNPVNANSQAQTAATTQGVEKAVSHEIRTPVAARGWAEEVGQKVSWVATRDSGRAELVLTPAQLGRVEVSIHMNGDQASASFVAANALAREALQDAMPRLREVLAQAGIQLGQASVDAGNGGNQAQAENAPGKSSRAHYAERDSGTGGSLPVAAQSSRWISSGNGMIDTFA